MGVQQPLRLHDGPHASMPPKARRLATLAAAGVAVPEGWVVPCAGEHEAVLSRALSHGPVAIRSAHPSEDGETQSGAGLGHTVLGVRTVGDAAAQLRTRAPSERVAIVQRQVRGGWMLVVAVAPTGTHFQAHRLAVDEAAAATLLDGHADPDAAGLLRTWADPVATRVATLAAEAVEAIEAGGEAAPHGWDLEIVAGIASEGPYGWVVQLRPLAVPLHPHWPAFCAAVAEQQGRDTPQLPRGRLTLDVEHNPEPLSVAHAWVIERLAQQRGAAVGDPVVLAHWLYVQTLVRELDRDAKPSAPRPLSPHRALQLLHGTLLPTARRKREALRAALAEPTPSRIREALDQAWAAFLSVIDAYVGTLVPARRAGAAASAEATAPGATRPAHPLVLRERARYLDVLPAAWDIASPSLAELGVVLDATPPALPLPEDPVEATALLSEWDDHLFALGMAPLRDVFLWVGRHTGLDEDVFLLRGEELVAACEGARPDLDGRARTRARHRTLRPPRSIEDGCPVWVDGRRTGHGLPIGPSVTGRATVRVDVAALLSTPPPPGSIVMMPALTAPAAVALHTAGVTAVCSEHGGPLSHATLMARELGLSALIGCRGCTDIDEGARVTLDTQGGQLRRAPTADVARSRLR